MGYELLSQPTLSPKNVAMVDIGCAMVWAVPPTQMYVAS